ncbi:MAG TPA: hypothetical protein VF092_00655 [Longimicrobium sp.]
MITTPKSLLLLPLVVVATASQTIAQREFTFAGVPWHAAADSARARLEARGFAFSGTVDRGDLVFQRGDGALVKLELQDGRAVGFLLVDTVRGRSVDARFHALVDSLQGSLGRPDTLREDLLVWRAGLSEMGVESYYRDGVHHVQLVWRGPGWYDEMGRRGMLPEFAPLPPGYTIVDVNFISRVAVDSARLTRGTDGVVRGRFRIDYTRPVGPEADLLDAAEYQMEFDCAARRTRLVNRSLFLRARLKQSDSRAAPAWEAPTPGGHHERGLIAVCRAAETLRPRP